MGRFGNDPFSKWANNNPIYFYGPCLIFLLTLIYMLLENIILTGNTKNIFLLIPIWGLSCVIFASFGLSPDRALRHLCGMKEYPAVDNNQDNSWNNVRWIGPRINKHPSWISKRGTAFELWLMEIYQGRGYQVTHTGGQRDHGTDLLLERNGRIIVVQAKGYGNKVRKDAVNEAHAAKSIYEADEAWVVTNNYFTDYAREHAKGCDVKLYDRNSLDRYLKTGRQFQGHREK